MRHAASRAGLGLLAAAEVLGAWMIGISIQAGVEQGLGAAWWTLVAVFGVLWIAAVVLTWQIARRIWPRHGGRPAKPL